MTTTDARHGTRESVGKHSLRSGVSILFPDPGLCQHEAEQPACFADLNLDQVVAAATAGRDEYDLVGFYHQPLQDPSRIRYRQDVLADLQTRPVREAVAVFAERMRVMRRYRRIAAQTSHGLQSRRWFHEAAAGYGEAVKALAAALDSADCGSDGFDALRRHLGALVTSSEFRRFVEEADAVRKDLSALEYTVNMKGAHVQVNAYAGEDELAPEVEATFARFAETEAQERQWKLKELAGLNRVEQQVLDRVARLFPEPFRRLGEFCRSYADAFDAEVIRFDREVQFYLGYLECIEPVTRSGLELSRPELSTGARERATAGFDLALAIKLAAAGDVPVTNDFRLEEPERVLVVTGPNQGGKTTFARMIGQMHYLASLGLPVPAAEASLRVPDRVFTHFEREEDLSRLRGKFEDELVRIREILDAATDRSVLVMNESFGSTTLADGLLVGSEIVREIIGLGSICVFVSFIDELASLGPETVSMMSTVREEEPAQRTFKVERKPADGLAYAAALARKYRLGYEELRRRIAS